MNGRWEERHSGSSKGFLKWMMQIIARMEERVHRNSEVECMGQQLGGFQLFEV